MELYNCWHALCYAIDSTEETEPKSTYDSQISNNKPSKEKNFFLFLVPLHFAFYPSSHSSSPPSSCQLEYFDWQQYRYTITRCDTWYSGPRRLEVDLVKNTWPAEATWNVIWGNIRKLNLADSFLVCLESKPDNAMSNSIYITAVF